MKYDFYKINRRTITHKQEKKSLFTPLFLSFNSVRFYKILIIFSALFISFLKYSTGQSIIPGLTIEKNAHKAEIPFERQGNFIILRVLFNNILPLRFIFDTGAEHCILTKKEVAILFNIPFEKEIIIRGSDLHAEIKAYISRKVKLGLDGVELTKDILVMDEDYFKFDKFAGLEIQGIIGAETFRNYVVKLDYTKQVMTIYEPTAFTASQHEGFDSLNIQILHNKPFINTQAQIETDSVVNLKLLLDTGAGLSMLLYVHSTPGLEPPKISIESNIGTGLGGDLTGFMGRLKKFSIGDRISSLNSTTSTVGSSAKKNSGKTGIPLSFYSVVAAFQEVRDLADTSFLLGRNGILGGEILSRFTTIIDFPKEKIYLKPNRDFKQSFKFDKSGLNFIAQGENLNKFTVNSVLFRSPASEAKIWRGDELISLQHISARFLSLATINNKLQGKTGKKIRLVLSRDGKKIVKFIILRDLI